MATSEIRSYEVTIAGETRSVEFKVWLYNDGIIRKSGSKTIECEGYSIENVGLYSKFGGGKQWARSIHIQIYTDGTFIIGRSTTILNRAGYPLIGWATSAIEHLKSRHLSA